VTLSALIALDTTSGFKRLYLSFHTPAGKERMTALTVAVTPTIAISIDECVTAKTYHTITRLETDVADLEVRLIPKYF